jgi:hypothetical protein
MPASADIASYLLTYIAECCTVWRVGMLIPPGRCCDEDVSDTL